MRATWAPRGQTPVLRHRFNWKRLSLAGALVYEPDGSDAHLFFELRPGAYNDETLIDFLSELNAVEQRSVLLIWDGLPSHRSRRMSDWIMTQHHWLSVEQLPGYAPDLNPIESAWGNLKSAELANLCSTTISDVTEIAKNGLNRIGTDAPQRSKSSRTQALAIRTQDESEGGPASLPRSKSPPSARRTPSCRCAQT